MDFLHTSDCTIVQGYKEDFSRSTALMPPLVKALGEILKSCQIILFFGAPVTVWILTVWQYCHLLKANKLWSKRGKPIHRA